MYIFSAFTKGQSCGGWGWFPAAGVAFKRMPKQNKKHVY